MTDGVLIKQLVAATYRAVLGREPDPNGLAAYAKLLGGKDLAVGIQRAIEGLMASTEFTRRWAIKSQGDASSESPYIDADDVHVVMITQNEEAMLPMALQPIANVFPTFTFVDMSSVDSTKAIISDILGSRARIINYDKHMLLNFGFAQARNFGSVFVRQPWIFSLDADEICVGGIVDGKIRIDKALGLASVVTVERKNFRPKGWQVGHPIDTNDAEIVSIERKRRIYRTGRGTHWDGYIHEELCGIDAETMVSQSDLRLDHISYFRDPEVILKRRHMYSWMLNKVFNEPEWQGGINRRWLTDYIPKNLAEIRLEAQVFENELAKK